MFWYIHVHIHGVLSIGCVEYNHDRAFLLSQQILMSVLMILVPVILVLLVAISMAATHAPVTLASLAVETLA